MARTAATIASSPSSKRPVVARCPNVASTRSAARRRRSRCRVRTHAASRAAPLAYTREDECGARPELVARLANRHQGEPSLTTNLVPVCVSRRLSRPADESTTLVIATREKRSSRRQGTLASVANARSAFGSSAGRLASDRSTRLRRGPVVSALRAGSAPVPFVARVVLVAVDDACRARRSPKRVSSPLSLVRRQGICELSGSIPRDRKDPCVHHCALHVDIPRWLHRRAERDTGQRSGRRRGAPARLAHRRDLRCGGLSVTTGTVNDAALAVRAAAFGVDAITTDRPAALRHELAAMSLAA
jgi:hypothetical protein